MLRSVVPGADPGAQAVSLQVTISHPPGGRLPLLSARPVFYLPSCRASPPFGWYQVILLGDNTNINVIIHKNKFLNSG